MESNTEKGKKFSNLAHAPLERMLGVSLDTEVSLAIGSPPRQHSFDFASSDRRYVGEAKAYAWRKGGKRPEAKLTGLKEAVQYLRLLSPGTKTFLVVKRDTNLRTGETLANYFARLNTYLLGDTAILELSEDGVSLRVVNKGLL